MIRPDVAELQGLPQGAPTSIKVQFLRHYRRLPQAEELRANEPPPRPQTSDQQLEWEVEEILERRTRGRREEFLLKCDRNSLFRGCGLAAIALRCLWCYVHDFLCILCTFCIYDFSIDTVDIC